MEPSPHAYQDLPGRTIYLYTNLYTDGSLVRAVFEAIEELREVYGIDLDLKIVDEGAIYGVAAAPLGFFAVQVFGKLIEFPYIEESDVGEEVKSRVIEEVIRNIGSVGREQARDVCPWSVGERPRYQDAVLVAQ